MLIGRRLCQSLAQGKLFEPIWNILQFSCIVRSNNWFKYQISDRDYPIQRLQGNKYPAALQKVPSRTVESSHLLRKNEALKERKTNNIVDLKKQEVKKISDLGQALFKKHNDFLFWLWSSRSFRIISKYLPNLSSSLYARIVNTDSRKICKSKKNKFGCRDTNCTFYKSNITALGASLSSYQNFSHYSALDNQV